MVFFFGLGVARQDNGAPVGSKGKCTSIIWMALNFSSTARGVRPGASLCSRRCKVTCKQ